MGINIEEKLGLGWLARPSVPTAAAPNAGPAVGPAPSAAPSPAVAAYAIVGKQILGVLKEAKDNTGVVHNLVDRLKLDIQTILEIVDWLERTGFVSVARDQYGNHTLRLTEAGQAWTA